MIVTLSRVPQLFAILTRNISSDSSAGGREGASFVSSVVADPVDGSAADAENVSGNVPPAAVSPIGIE